MVKFILTGVLLMSVGCLYGQNEGINTVETPKSEEETKQSPEGTKSEDLEVESDEKSTELQELVVKGDNAWYEDGKAVFLPQKSAKNLSRSMEDLIERMHTGLLTVDNGAIKTINGRPVTIYINGVKADNLDASTFWPKNALRVEYMQSSSDPKFAGSTDIVNFVMRDYVAGGLTKIEADQTFPNNGSYQASSKLVWGRMTYQALFNGAYSRDHLSGNEMTENYDDVWYKGTHYDNIERKENVDTYSRSNDLYGAFSARYIGGNFITTHSVGVQWNQNPGSGSHGLSVYDPRIINGTDMMTYSDGRSLSPVVNGEYSYNRQKWGVSGGWNLTQSHNCSNSSYEDDPLSPILTDITEDFYSGMAKISGWYMPLPNKLSLSFLAKQTFDYYNTRYDGTTVSRQQQNNATTALDFMIWYSPISKLIFVVRPQYSLYLRDVNHHIKTTENVAGLRGTIWYEINRKSYLSFNSWYAQIAPSVSERNDLILRQTELKWIEGNPEGKISDLYNFSLNYGITPSSWFNTNLMLTCSSKNNQSVISYRPGGIEYDGVIGRYDKAVRVTSWEGMWVFNLSLFNHRLNISNQLTYNYSKTSGHSRCICWRTRPDITWNFGNCSLYGWYSSPQNYFVSDGIARGKMRQQYGLKFSYGNGNFIFDCGVENLFNKHMIGDVWFESGAYSYVSRNWHVGRQVSVSLTYTFDYGKKVTPGIDLTTGNIKSTSVLGSE